MNCIHCAFFCEALGYCSMHDMDVTRYNECSDFSDSRTEAEIEADNDSYWHDDEDYYYERERE